MRGGVPVLKRPTVKPSARNSSERPSDGPSPARPPGDVRSPTMSRPLMNVPVVRITAPADERSAAGEDAGDALAPISVALDEQLVDRGLLQVEAGLSLQRILHRQAIGLLVALRAQRLHGWTFGGVEQPHLDEGAVGGAAHLAAERVDLAHEMALGWPPIEGLQGISATLSRFIVSSSVRDPCAPPPAPPRSPRGLPRRRSHRSAGLAEYQTSNHRLVAHVLRV